MSFYRKVVEGTMKGFTLKGGPFAKWRYPVNRVLYKKRLVAGPEPERPRSVWQNWNYDSEIFAFAHRLNENFKESLLRQAMIHPSYSIGQSKHKELGIDIDVTHNNLKLSIDGEKICENYLRAILGFWYPKLPQDGVSAIVNYLIETENLANIARNLGIKDLVQTQEFPVKNETLRSVLMAVIAALEQSSGPIRAHLFINDFILAPSLIGKDINEIWQVKNPMGLLCEELKKSGAKSLPVPRLIWSTGANHPTGVFIVGLYVDEQMISKGSGENLDIAEEMAARDALRRLFGTEEDKAPLPYGDRARKFSQNILPLYDSLMKKNA